MTLFELVVALTMDDKDFQDKLKGAGEKASALGSGVAKAFGVAGAAVGAAGTAVAAFAKQSMDGYAEYEQLAGGIETLFGAGGQSIEEYAASVGKSVDAVAGEYSKLMGAQDLVLANAEKAYMTAGMSMNDYMNTAIQSAAALTNSLKGDTAKAAELMDMSIVDMSDNVNKMGTSMEAVQNAYRGFSRGNFTMLDNLALGFSGTKEGMQQLLDKAKEISGFKYDISSYSDIVQAIHVVQEEMGIAGTTQKEANETISGSMNSLRSAWDNLIVGFSKGDADLSKLIGNVVDSAVTVADNVIPVVTQAVSGIVQGIEQAAPLLAEELPKFVDKVLPDILNAGATLLTSLGEVLPQTLLSILGTLGGTVIDYLPQLAEIATNLITTFADGIAQAVPVAIPAAIDGIFEALGTILDHAPDLLGAGVELVGALGQGILDGIAQMEADLPELIVDFTDSIVEKLPGAIEDIVNGFKEFYPQYIDQVVDFGFELVESLTYIIDEVGPVLVDAIPGLISMLLTEITVGLPRILDFLLGIIPDIIESCVNIAAELIPTLLTDVLPMILEAIPGFVMSIIQVLGERLPDILDAILNGAGVVLTALWGVLDPLVTDFDNFLSEILDNIAGWFAELPGQIWEWLNEVLDAIGQWGSQMVSDASQAASDTIDGIIDFFSELPGRIWEWLTNVIRDIGRWAIDLVDGGKKAADDLVKTVVDAVMGLPGQLWDAGVNAVKGFVDGITSMGSFLWDNVTGFFGGLIDGVEDVFDINSPSRVFRGIGKNVMLGAAIGVDDGIPDVADAMDRFENEINRDFKSPVVRIRDNSGAGMRREDLPPLIQTRNADTEKNTTIILEIDGVQLAKLLYPYSLDESRRMGVNLAGVRGAFA